jgi:acetate kinase
MLSENVRVLVVNAGSSNLKLRVLGSDDTLLRADACRGLRFIGIQLDEGKNGATEPGDADLTGRGGSVRVLGIHSREDLAIAREVRGLLQQPAPEGHDRGGGSR